MMMYSKVIFGLFMMAAILAQSGQAAWIIETNKNKTPEMQAMDTGRCPCKSYEFDYENDVCAPAESCAWTSKDTYIVVFVLLGLALVIVIPCLLCKYCVPEEVYR